MTDDLSPQALAAIKATVRDAVREELAEAGLRLDGIEHQDDAREDFRFLRRLRRAADGTASRIGWAIIAALTGGLIWLIWQGANFWKGN